MATQASDSIRQRSRTTTADELAVIVQRAQSFTNASGAAIAIGEGNNTNEIVCRARSGSSAPDVGTSLRVDGSFTGVCIQSGKELRCDDAETDTRVDTGAIRALGIRSMVVTPIRDEGKVVGVLAVFAPTPHAFTITHVAVLKTMADQISALLQRDRRTTKDEPIAAAVPVPVSMPKPPAAVPLPPPVVIKPASAPPSASVAAAPAPVRSNPPSMPRMETRPVALAADIAAPVPFPRREEKREFRPEPAPAPKASFGTLDAVAGETKKSSGNKLILVGVIVAVVAVGATAWFFIGMRKSNAPAQAQTQQQPQNTTPAAPTAAATTPNPVVSSSAPPATAPVTSSSARTDATERVESKKNEAKKKEQQNTPPPAPAPATVALASGPSKISQSTPTDQSPDVAPTLAVGNGSSSGLASLARPVSSSTPSMIAQSDLVNAKAIRTVPAVYPELAKARRISGTAVVRVTVGKDGKVKNPVFVSGPIIFRDAAFDAVKQWVFKPAELNGQAIEQDTEIRVKFSPS